MKTQKITSNIISKVALLSLIFIFVGMTTTFAQKRGKRNNNATPTEKAEKRSQKWKTEFSLNDTQTAQLKTALVKRITATDALKAEEKGKEKRTKMKAIKTEFDADVKGFFTAEQYVAYEKMKEEKKAKRKENRGNRKRGQGTDMEDDGF
ncbi:hypothetical protein WAF17_17765 [Bernardetia sp. ABR2-2B]|uniref:hypothetical protein n=1 Tax=Bernardetia sp. ABR2-2B TaxID=3127472 RepID=UPI0030CACA8B